MNDVTLHFRADGQGRCTVCGADLEQRVSRWWLANTWTRDRRHYCEQETNWPGKGSRPCGVLQRHDDSKTHNVEVSRRLGEEKA